MEAGGSNLYTWTGREDIIHYGKVAIFCDISNCGMPFVYPREPAMPETVHRAITDYVCCGMP